MPAQQRGISLAKRMKFSGRMALDRLPGEPRNLPAHPPPAPCGKQCEEVGWGVVRGCTRSAL